MGGEDLCKKPMRWLRHFTLAGGRLKMMLRNLRSLSGSVGRPEERGRGVVGGGEVKIEKEDGNLARKRSGSEEEERESGVGWG